MNCHFCGNAAVYRCSRCGRLACTVHTKQQTVCLTCVKKEETRREETGCVVVRATSKREKDEIRKLVTKFWGEEEQLTFDREYNVLEQHAYCAIVREKIVGFISFNEQKDNFIIVGMVVCPEHQGSGIGRCLIERVESEARRLKKKQLLVSTSNDNLSALGFYQALGFQIFGVVPDAIARKHGKIIQGANRLPLRDELRLRKILG